ncbi:tetratricopeptide repeat protein [Parerythrobacter jejuensis]|uniref:Tetratricopeptide repeat protein n=1 Tax=Parerythrobacter jejuensis TaxID=795812 RepID=A0A845AXQ0_9SPHN|nr:tetratricopeptide repeat protein [Parerythrobacter jejuensis]MXP31245.1 tetratricopeptide repeat protein [Parerythrobacter jejuensis]MXP34005.1 tetratricopeptide repeat protein [Parerythrobacter jejuensis]
MGLNLDEQKAVDRFRSKVVEPSMSKLVILDFWAEWCGPCKALTPTLEKVAAEYAEKGVILEKVNVDEEQFIASQFQVKSIPTIYAMFQGQPVADLSSARTESQIKEVLDQLLEKLPLEGGEPSGPSAEEVAQFVAMGEQVLSDGDADRAAGIFKQVLDMDPTSAVAASGYLRSLIEAGHTDEATAMLAQMPEDIAKDPAIERARAALELASNQVDDSELAGLKASAASNPGDMEARFAYAEAAFSAGQRDDAANELLAMVETDKEWNEGAARTKLLQIFEAVGLEDEWVVSTRRRLSKILFG